MTKPWKLSLSEGLGQISEGNLTANDWIRSLFERVDACEDKVQAWAAQDREGALSTAQKIDSGRSRGKKQSPLSGAPIGIKDIINVKGLPCEANSPILRGNVPDEDAYFISKLREAGAIIMGKTITTQFATGDPSETRNPWNLAHSPGGSSSGSAASVATGMAPAALGSQTGGSILRPSAYCGVIGFKPTYGLVSRTGVVEVSWSLDHIGTITRSARDAALLLPHLAGADPADESTRGFEFPDFEIFAPSKPQKAHYPREGVRKYAPAEVCEWIERGVNRLSENGVDVEDIEFPLDFQKLHDTHRMIMAVEGAAFHEKMFSEHAEKYRPVIRALVENGLKTDAMEYARGLRRRGRLRADLDEMMGGCDILILPSFQEPPALAEESTGSAFFNEPATQTGLPAVTLPLGRGDNHTPFGIQFVGRRWEDTDLLAAAGWCEAELGWNPEIAEPQKKLRGAG